MSTSNDHGRRVWFFPDGELPQRDPDFPYAPNPAAYGHESLVILNPHAKHAEITLTFYFPAVPPVKVEGLSVEGERVRCYRLDEKVGPKAYQVPQGQYALKLESTEPVIVQIGRMDVRQPNIAYYTTMGFAAS